MKPILKFMVFVILLFCAGTSLALEMIYPEDGTYIVQSDFIVIKGGDNPPLDGLTIEINGLKSSLIDISSSEYKAVFRDFLILEPEFEEGKNSIKLEGYSQGQVVRKTAANIFYQKSANDPPPSGYRPFVMHLPQKEALCAPCHNMNPTADQLKLTSPEKNPCASCHKRMLNKKYVHGPAGVFRCTYCHDPQSAPSRYRARSGDASVCNECHLGKVKAFGQNKFIHGPVAAGMCGICHDPHASDHPAQLFAPINDVCLSCHEKLQVKTHFTQGVGKGHPVGGVPDPQAPGRELSCSSCHNAHGGATRVFFDERYQSSMMLCTKCHKK